MALEVTSRRTPIAGFHLDMEVFFAVVPRHGRWGRIEMTLEDLRAAVAGAPASARTDVER